jgi:multiple sugar transport system substrate-binding protein/arabinosaccharide transport system substrate-binding protein
MLKEVFGQSTSRRRFLIGASAFGALPLLQACSSAVATPTPAPAVAPASAAPTATAAPAQPAAVATTAPTAVATQPAATATTAPAAAAAPAGPKQATFTLWTGDVTMNDYLNRRFAEWAPSQPAWQLKTNFQQIPDPNTKELTALASGQGIPDMFSSQIDQFSRFQKGDICATAFTDLTPLIQAAGGPQNYVKLGIYSWKGKTYAIDWVASPVIYFYREDLFQAAGVKLPLVTFDDLLSEGKKLQDKKQYMDQFFLEPTFWVAEFDKYLEARNGPGVFDKDGKVLLDSPEAIDTLQFLSDLILKYKVTDLFDTGNAQTAGYERNQVAGTVMADWWANYVMATTYKDQVGKWRAQAMPQQVKGVDHTAAWGGQGITISQKSENRDLILDFYRFCFCVKENFAKIMVEDGYLPTMRSAWDLPAVANYQSPLLGNQNLGAVVSKVTSTMVDSYYGPFWNEHLPIVAKAVTSVLVDKAQPADALKTAATDLRGVIAKG